MKKFLLVLFILISLSFAKYVELGETNIIYEVSKYGNVHVIEEVTYILNDCEDDPFREVYTEKPKELKIMNPTGYCANTKCRFRYDTYSKSISGENELVLELQDKKCGEIKAKFEYDVYPIVIARDTAQFYYKIWGDKSPSANIYVKIILPGEINKKIIEYEYEENEVKNFESGEIENITKEIITNEKIESNVNYFVHKKDKNYEVYESGNILEIKSYQQSNELLEINLLMPKEWFIENNNYIYRKDLSKNDIIEVEEREMLLREYEEILNLIFTFLFILYLLIPFCILGIIYYLYGKELTPEDVNYNSIYERELPSNHSPAEALFYIKGDEEYSEKEKSNVIVATIMSYINKGIISIEEREKDVFLKIDNTKLGTVEMKKYEEELIDYLYKVFGSKEFSIKEFEKKVSGKVEYYQLINRFFMLINKTVNKKNEYVDDKGNKIGGIALSIYFVLSFFLMFISPFGSVAIFSVIIALIIIKSKKIMLAKWTEKGRILNLKWENFKKYITDYSLMKEHPPESVKIWDEYLTYAIALGVADKTSNIMKKISPKEIKLQKNSISNVYITSNIILGMNKTFTPSYVSKNSSSGGYSGMSGGFGGGMGGGGFGGR